MNYFFSIDGTHVVGPHPLADLSRDFFSGALPLTTQVCAEGTELWQTLESLVTPKPHAVPPPLPGSPKVPPLQNAFDGAGSSPASQGNAKTVYTMKGTSQLLEVHADKLALTPQGVIGRLRLKGTKTIPFHSITAIQFKKAGFTPGYLQFTIPGGNESQGGAFAAVINENSFTFRNVGDNNEWASKIKNYIESRVNESRVLKSAPSASISDEIQKLANLRRDGVLSDEEFNSAKTRLLSR